MSAEITFLTILLPHRPLSSAIPLAGETTGEETEGKQGSTLRDPSFNVTRPTIPACSISCDVGVTRLGDIVATSNKYRHIGIDGCCDSRHASVETTSVHFDGGCEARHEYRKPASIPTEYRNDKRSFSSFSLFFTEIISKNKTSLELNTYRDF